MEFLVVLAVLVVVVLFISAPLRRAAERGRRPATGPAETAENELAELQAAREAKYREIRDAELDYRMGKVGEADYHATDRELRGQAIAILRELDETAS